MVKQFGRDAAFEASFRRHLLLATLAGITLRLLLVALVRYEPIQGDARAYDLLARNLAERGIYSLSDAAPFTPTAERPPLLPFVAAVSYRLFATSRLPIHLLQAASGLAVAFVITLVMRRLVPRAAALTAWFTMLSPFDAIYAGTLLSEPLTTFFTCVGISIPILFESSWAWIGAGALFGAATLARDTALPIAPMAACAALAFPVLRGRVGWVAPLLICAGTAIVVLPWTYRNCRAIGTCAPVTKGRMGSNLWVGTWARDGSWATPQGRVWPKEAFENEAERDQIDAVKDDDFAGDDVYRRIALSHIEAHPVRVFLRWVVRVRTMWIGTRTDLFEFRSPFAPKKLPWYALKAFCFALNVTWLVLAAVGLFWSARHARRLLWLAIPIAATFLVYFPFNNSETRYSQPVYPLLLAFSALGAITGREALRDRFPPSKAARRAPVATSSAHLQAS